MEERLGRRLLILTAHHRMTLQEETTGQGDGEGSEAGVGEAIP